MKIINKPKIKRESMAVIVVDMQNDFVSKGGKFVENSPGYYQAAQEIIPRIKVLLEEARAAAVPIIFTATHYQKDYVDAGLLSLSRELDALGSGTWGAEIVKELLDEAREGYYLVEKQRYSAFYGTNLEILLRGLKAETLVITGFAANICVESTARAARDADFFPVVVSDCTASFSPELWQSALTNVDRFFGSAMESKEVIAIMQGKGPDRP